MIIWKAILYCIKIWSDSRCIYTNSGVNADQELPVSYLCYNTQESSAHIPGETDGRLEFSSDIQVVAKYAPLQNGEFHK